MGGAAVGSRSGLTAPRVSRLSRSGYVATHARTPADVAEAQALRHRAFRGGEGRDADAQDDACTHVLIRRRQDGAPVGCFRLRSFADGRGIGDSYSAGYYDLGGLAAYDRPMLELGRFCVAPGETDPDILRVAFAALGQEVETTGAALLFGCSSFPGTEAGRHAEAFALLQERHIAPLRWRPRVKAPSVVRFAQLLRGRTGIKADPMAALKAMPPLLRSYLALGGWVSDHAVIDRDLQTLHVFTGVEVAAIPAGRARILRGMAG